MISRSKPIKRSALKRTGFKRSVAEQRDSESGTPRKALKRSHGLSQRPKRATRTVDGDSSKDIKLELDELVRQIIRLRDDHCFTCGKKRGFVNLEVGHMYRRGIQVLRWNLLNCNAQCGGFAGSCNDLHESDPGPYHLAFIRKYCMDDFFMMEQLSDSKHKHTYIQLLSMRDQLRTILEGMKR